MIEEVLNKTTTLLGTIGRSGLSALYPNEFEVYIMSLELVKTLANNQEEVIDFFSFPVMPSQFSQIDPQITNIKKNFGGITIINTNTFIPKDIQISGNFGRNFKISTGNGNVDFSAMSYSSVADDSKLSFKKQVVEGLKANKQLFSYYVKNGYGCIKILQSICDKSLEVDDGRPRKLFFHNPMYGESYLVKVNIFTANMNQQSNMIYNYNLGLKAVAPTDSVRNNDKNGLSDSLKIGTLQNSVNFVAKQVGNLLRTRSF